MELDFSKIAVLGAQIAEVGLRLNSLREQRRTLDEQVRAAETELRPLLLEHAAILSAITGVSPVAASPEVAEPRRTKGGSKKGGSNLQQRIQQFIAQHGGEEPLSATNIAEALQVDAFAVRMVLNQMRPSGRDSDGEEVIEEDDEESLP